MMMATQFVRSEIMPNVFFSNTPETYIKAEDMLMKFLFLQSDLPANSSGNTRTMLEICSKLKLKDTRTISVNFEQISHIVLVFPLLTLNK